MIFKNGMWSCILLVLQLSSLICPHIYQPRHSSSYTSEKELILIDDLKFAVLSSITKSLFIYKGAPAMQKQDRLGIVIFGGRPHISIFE